VVFEPNDEPLWAHIPLNVGAFMHILFRYGAFQGTKLKDAYFVKYDGETTGQDDTNKTFKSTYIDSFCNSFVCRGVKMNGRKKVLIALFSALVLLVAVTLTGCFGDEERIDLYSELPDFRAGIGMSG
jgi:hypothetical protein